MEAEKMAERAEVRRSEGRGGVKGRRVAGRYGAVETWRGRAASKQQFAEAL